ncbi:hypothetical protein PIIN_11068 [Serendipita indica DSM 11827]|uniref:Uncharacterized protein n=1 Tax=Serendipita indica (strain DSM 11827) TaxID=1109443 RepID=G4U0J0_SERID|nr:hypothetical protein PIIN_11068 [Serendipita indica DSM 11827]
MDALSDGLVQPGRGPSHSDPDASEPANKAKIAKMSPEEQEKVLKTAEILFGVSDRQLDRHQRALGFVTCRHRVETTWKKGEPLPDSSENTGGSGYFSASTAPSALLAFVGWKFDQLRKGDPKQLDRYPPLDIIGCRATRDNLEDLASEPPSTRDCHRGICSSLRHARDSFSLNSREFVLIPSHWSEPVTKDILQWYDPEAGPRDHQPLQEPIPKKLPLTDPINDSPAQATSFTPEDPEEEEELADNDHEFDVMSSPPRKQTERESMTEPRHFIESELLRRRLLSSLDALGDPMVMEAVFESKKYKEIRATSRRLFQYYKNKMRLQSIVEDGKSRDRTLARVRRTSAWGSRDVQGRYASTPTAALDSGNHCDE